MQVNNPDLLAAGVVSMVDSGNQGGNPVMSKPGIETKAGFMCYSDIGGARFDKQVNDFGNFDINKVPIDILKEKIRLTLMGIDKDVIQLHLEAARKEYEENVRAQRDLQKQNIATLNSSGKIIGGSPTFQNEGRQAKAQREVIETLDKFYSTKQDYIKPKVPFLVNMTTQAQQTLPRFKPIAPLCSKGEESCRHSDRRIQEKIQFINNVLKSENAAGDNFQNHTMNSKLQTLRKADKLRLETQTQFTIQNLASQKTQADTFAINTLSDQYTSLYNSKRLSEQNSPSQTLSPLQKQFIQIGSDIVNHQDYSFMTSFYNTQNRDRNNQSTTLRTQGVGLVELDRRTSRGVVGSMMQYEPNPCEARFETINVMPNIASKFKRRDRTTIFATQADRTDEAIITKTQGDIFYGGNKVYIYPAIKGSVKMELQSERVTKISNPEPYYQNQPTLYTQTPEFLEIKKKEKQQRGGSFNKQLGRDNKMYEISEGYNLKNPKTQQKNAFQELILASNMAQVPVFQNEKNESKSALQKKLPKIVNSQNAFHHKYSTLSLQDALIRRVEANPSAAFLIAAKNKSELKVKQSLAEQSEEDKDQDETIADSQYQTDQQSMSRIKKDQKDDEMFGKLQVELEDASGGLSLEDRILRGQYKPVY